MTKNYLDLITYLYTLLGLPTTHMNTEELDTLANDLEKLYRISKEIRSLTKSIKAGRKAGNEDDPKALNLLANWVACLASHSMGFAQVGDDEQSEQVKHLTFHLAGVEQGTELNPLRLSGVRRI